tara:strand:+ start:210 stop:398 length:189 start_codon:yes stop_codon:yes gene_type:complete
MKNKHTITFEVGDDGVENLKFDADWKIASAFYKWDHLNDLIGILSKEYEGEGADFEKQTVNE